MSKEDELKKPVFILMNTIGYQLNTITQDIVDIRKTTLDNLRLADKAVSTAEKILLNVQELVDALEKLRIEVS